MLHEVWLRAAAADRIDRLIVATDDRRILDAAREFGAEAMMTSSAHPSGTDRVAEVARAVGDGHDIVVNIQGDEPLLTPTCLDRLIGALDDGAAEMATPAEPIDSADQLFDPNAVKVVANDAGCALYFSRSPIPYRRGAGARLDADFRDALSERPAGLAGYRRHQGLYAYRRTTLLRLTELPPSSLEIDEGLEQLRALQAGVRIRVVDSDFRSMSVDTPEDLRRVVRALDVG